MGDAILCGLLGKGELLAMDEGVGDLGSNKSLVMLSISMAKCASNSPERNPFLQTGHVISPCGRAGFRTVTKQVFLIRI